MYALRVQIESRSAKAWFCLRDFIFGNNSFSLALLDSSLVEGAKEDFVIPLPPRRSRANFASRSLRSRLCSDACSSRAVESALGQETARTMRRFRVRKWATPHCGVAKKALAHPLPANLLLRKIFAGALYKRGVPRARKAGVWRKELPYFSLP